MYTKVRQATEFLVTDKFTYLLTYNDTQPREHTRPLR